ncbi:MAG: glycosyltransferase family 2 protein [Myxococcales bacterium]|nr:glycosyltransferase family 2 protein [Myxococcales bacterium]
MSRRIRCPEPPPEASADGADILIKVDGDGQMDPSRIPQLIAPILRGDADYVKGDRFFSAETLRRMPWVRLIGNAGLSLMAKFSSGYWNLFDPTNGFTALEARVAQALPLDRIHPGYFFESDILFRLGVLRARVVELPLQAVYGDETSNLSVLHALLTFPFRHARNAIRRIGYSYFLRNFGIASLNLVSGSTLLTLGIVFGVQLGALWGATQEAATAGSVILAALPSLLGAQRLLSFIQHDVSDTPRSALHRHLSPSAQTRCQGTAPEGARTNQLERSARSA